MINTFNDTLPDGLRIPTHCGKSAIDSDAVRGELARAIGWYRKETVELKSAKDMRAKGIEISKLLMQLYERMETPDGMSPELRFFIRENLQQLGVAMPEFGRLAACFDHAVSQLPAPKTGHAGNEIRNSTANSIYLAIREHSVPQMPMGAARELTATLLSACDIKLPADEKERRGIMRG